MKKSFLALLMVLVLAVTAMAPAFAEEETTGGLLNGVINKIRTHLSEKSGSETEVYVLERVVKGILEKAKDLAGKGKERLEELLGGLTDEEGKLNLSAIKNLLGGLSVGTEEIEDEELTEEDIENSPYLKAWRNRDEAVRLFMADTYADKLEAGDVQIDFSKLLSTDEDDFRYNLGCAGLLNYTADGKDLKLKNAAMDMVFVELSMKEDYTFDLVEAFLLDPEDEGYEDTINALLEKMGMERTTFDNNIDEMHVESSIAMQVWTWLTKHPEYERIEYNGEMKTVDEMEEAYFDILGKIFDAIDFSDITD